MQMDIPNFVKRISLATVLACSLTMLIADVFAAELERINPPGIYKHPAFTRVITARGGKMIFVAGQTPSDMEYKCVTPGDYKAQYIALMDGLKMALQAAGATLDDVVHRRAFVLDMDKYLAVTRAPDMARRYWNRDKLPASTAIQVSRLSDPCSSHLDRDLVAVVE
jgi:enamine deaminase RidA (YjgF/YER057c/UK114 family)